MWIFYKGLSYIHIKQSAASVQRPQGTIDLVSITHEMKVKVGPFVTVRQTLEQTLGEQLRRHFNKNATLHTGTNANIQICESSHYTFCHQSDKGLLKSNHGSKRTFLGEGVHRV